MTFVKIVAFVLIEKKDEEAVNKAFHEVIDDFVIRRLPIFDSGLTSINIQTVANADEILREMLDPSEAN